MSMRKSLYFETFALAFAVLLLEVSYTRVFSFKLVYYFAYLVIGIAMLGLGMGGVLVAIRPRLRTTPIEGLLRWCGLGGGVAVAAGYLLVATVPLYLFELVVGLMLVFLGGQVLVRMRRRRIHLHVHQHGDGTAHLHVHRHERDESHDPNQHEHPHPARWPLRALVVGVVHGLAGSAALLLLTLSRVGSLGLGLAYIALF